MSIFHGSDKHTVQELFEHLDRTILEGKKTIIEAVYGEQWDLVVYNADQTERLTDLRDQIRDYFNNHSDGPGGKICSTVEAEKYPVHPMTPENQVPVDDAISHVIGDWSDA